MAPRRSSDIEMCFQLHSRQFCLLYLSYHPTIIIKIAPDPHNKLINSVGNHENEITDFVGQRNVRGLGVRFCREHINNLGVWDFFRSRKSTDVYVYEAFPRQSFKQS